MKNIIAVISLDTRFNLKDWVDRVAVPVWLCEIVRYYESIGGLNRRKYQNERTDSESCLKGLCKEIIQTVVPIKTNISP
jgi:hypothetical protein